MFSGIKQFFSSFVQKITSKLQLLFAQDSIDQTTIHELEKILLEADIGVAATRKIINALQEDYKKGSIKSGNDIKTNLKNHLVTLLTPPPDLNHHNIFLLVGINGSGKTTAIGKLAAYFENEGKKVLIVAADTFRAAAKEQVSLWAQKIGTEIVTGTENQDPASVVYSGCKKFKEENFDILLIDTAGRLQTKINLMKELEKIKRVITKALPVNPASTLLTIDAMLGQNSFEQARIFHENTNLTGIILTKTDGTAKGGIIFAINQEFNIPVMFISYGEQKNQLKRFDPQDYVDSLLS